ncbi:hypothetical protein BX666DRAFT_2025323 [Dichotomocladium elegans]|nr:hypothetical protein BX666DRAFT_2025323 [Dichotomocladium elegans]
MSMELELGMPFPKLVKTLLLAVTVFMRHLGNIIRLLFLQLQPIRCAAINCFASGYRQRGRLVDRDGHLGHLQDRGETAADIFEHSWSWHFAVVGHSPEHRSLSLVVRIVRVSAELGMNVRRWRISNERNLLKLLKSEEEKDEDGGGDDIRLKEQRMAWG